MGAWTLRMNWAYESKESVSIRTQGTEDASGMGILTSTFGGHGSMRTGYENLRKGVQWAPESLIEGGNSRGPGKSIEYTDLGVESLRYKDPVDLKIQEQKQKE
ncbi:hypothetical protein SESBI_38892 [Sesbania bispinosa]|nr:hypothetical protein SESBI_38892 [Sesbania bispinosa]